MVEFLKKLIKIGNASLGITIPKEIVEILDLKEDEILSVKIERTSPQKKTYKCKKCNNYFIAYDETKYCSKCGETLELLEVVEND